ARHGRYRNLAARTPRRIGESHRDPSKPQLARKSLEKREQWPANARCGGFLRDPQERAASIKSDVEAIGVAMDGPHCKKNVCMVFAEGVGEQVQPNFPRKSSALGGADPTSGECEMASRFQAAKIPGVHFLVNVTEVTF